MNSAGSLIFAPSLDVKFEAMKDDPAETLKWLTALRDFWYRGTEPKLKTSLERSFWDGLKDELARIHHRANAMRGNQNAKKQSKTVENSPKQSETVKNSCKQTKQTVTELRKDKDKDKDKDKAKDKEEDRATSYDVAVVPHKETKKESAPKAKRSTLTSTKSASTLRGLYPQAMAFWDSVRQVYPSHRRHQPSEGILQLIEREGLIDREQEILNKIIAFTQKDDGWRRGFVPRMSHFFEQGLYENDPTPPKPPEVRVIQTIHTSKPPAWQPDPDKPQDLPL